MAGRPLRALIVEDSHEVSGLLLAELARGGFDVSYTRVHTIDTMRVALSEHQWDVVLSDHATRDFSSFAALTLLWELGIDVPLIVVSETAADEVAVTFLKAGAADFLAKDRLARLNPTIERELRQAEGRRTRRSVEQAFSETRDRMQFALQAAGVGTWETDLATGHTIWSEILERLHGLPPGGFGGSSAAFVDCIHPDDRDEVLNRIAQAVRERTDSRLEYRTEWPDGSMHWIVSIGRTFFNDTGLPVRAAGVSFDVTAQSVLEEQARQSQRLESVGALAAGIAHDFNNLLTVVAGYCQLLTDRFADDEAALGDLAEISRASSSAAALIHQLLAFSRRQILAPQIVDLDTIVTSTHKMLRRLVEENVRIDLRLSGNLRPISVDAGQMEQVLVNLVTNAKDAMPDGGSVTIETSNAVLDQAYQRTYPDVRPGPYTLLSVTDTGGGIAPSVQARLFEPFFTTKERGRGTGLGLATVYGIVKQSGGHIALESELGKGSTFKVYLPAASGEIVRAAGRPAAHAPLGSETILVVEDESAVRTLTERILRRHGYTVLTAVDGADAQRICLAHDGPIHVVLTDVILPGGNGRTVGEWVTRHRPEARLLYMSGYTDNAIAHHGILDPGTQLLQKPFSADSLATKIREVLS